MKCVQSSCLFKYAISCETKSCFLSGFCLKKFAITNEMCSFPWIKFHKMITCHFVELCSLRWEALGWFLFYAGNAAAAFGSAYYHLKPDDDRLIWDRLPVSEYFFLAVIFSLGVFRFGTVRCGSSFLKLVLEKMYYIQFRGKSFDHA